MRWVRLVVMSRVMRMRRRGTWRISEILSVFLRTVYGPSSSLCLHGWRYGAHRVRCYLFPWCSAASRFGYRMRLFCWRFRWLLSNNMRGVREYAITLPSSLAFVDGMIGKLIESTFLCQCLNKCMSCQVPYRFIICGHILRLHKLGSNLVYFRSISTAKKQQSSHTITATTSTKTRSPGWYIATATNIELVTDLLFYAQSLPYDISLRNYEMYSVSKAIIFYH